MFTNNSGSSTRSKRVRSRVRYGRYSRSYHCQGSCHCSPNVALWTRKQGAYNRRSYPHFDHRYLNNYHVAAPWERPVEYVRLQPSLEFHFLLFHFRRDKKLFKPQTIKSWFIVIYENQGRFNQGAAEAMAKAFCGGAESVGGFISDPCG